MFMLKCLASLCLSFCLAQLCVDVMSCSSGTRIFLWNVRAGVVTLHVVLQLPCLNSLSFEGPPDRRHAGLDITDALAALAATAAAEAAPAAAAGSTASVCCHIQHQQKQQHQQLTRLELRAGRLSDAVMAAVGQLSGLRCLQLSATTAIDTAPLSALMRLSHLQLTVTPPLWSALAPLSGGASWEVFICDVAVCDCDGLLGAI
jgi:hypothetical protein